MNVILFSQIQTLFDPSLVDRIGLALLHSVWQVALLAVLFAVVRSILQRRKNASNAIYWMGMMTLVVALLLPIATFSILEARQSAEPVAMTLQVETRQELSAEMIPGSSESRFLLLDAPNAGVDVVEVEAEEIGRSKYASNPISVSLWAITDWLPQHSLVWVASVWMLGAILFSLRTMLGFIHVQSLRATCSAKLSKPVQDVAERALRRFPVGVAVQFAISKRIHVPTVIGIVRPIVLFPVSVLTELTPEQLELIIVHELAHIRRQDLLLNLIQTVIETLMFFHPCVWWISSIVRAERENCCDDAAVTQGSAASYANALLRLENSRTPNLSVAANGSDLLTRVQRLAGAQKANPNSDALPTPWMAGMIGMVVLAGLMFFPDANEVIAQESNNDYQSQKIAKDFAKTSVGKVLDREMDKLKKVGFSGSILVAHEGEIILARSEGFADTNKKKKTRPTTVYEIASTTKSFTSTAVMILAQQGKLDLDASIAEYLPNVPVESKKITVMDLLMHESGIPATNYGNTRKDLATAVETMLAGGPQKKRGSNFEYWNQGYILLSEIVSKAAGKPYTEFLREEIFEPCGMSGTCFTGDSLPKGFRESIGFGKLGKPRSCLEHPYGKMELVYQGTGGIVSNVVDMWKFHKALMADDLLTKEFRETMFEKGVSNYACGWFVTAATNEDKKQSHTGGVRGFCSDFRRFPETDSCIVVLSNNDSAPASMVANVIEGVVFPPVVPGEQLGKAVEKKIVGEYKDARERMLIVFAGDAGTGTHYMIYWDPKNPRAPISRGSVLQGDDDEIIFYQPGDSQVVNVVYSKDKTQVQSVEYLDTKMKFKRFDIEAWSKAQRK